MTFILCSGRLQCFALTGLASLTGLLTGVGVCVCPQGKLQKHQAFEAEVQANAGAIIKLDDTGSLMITEGHFASEIIRVRESHTHTHTPPHTHKRNVYPLLNSVICGPVFHAVPDTTETHSYEYQYD